MIWTDVACRASSFIILCLSVLIYIVIEVRHIYKPIFGNMAYFRRILYFDGILWIFFNHIFMHTRHILGVFWHVWSVLPLQGHQWVSMFFFENYLSNIQKCTTNPNGFYLSCKYASKIITFEEGVLFGLRRASECLGK